MTDGIIDCGADVRWLLAAGMAESDRVDVFVSALTEVGLWYAYEMTQNEHTSDMQIDEDGYLVIALNDDANFGWFHYQRRALSDETARAAVIAKFGQVVRVPCRAMLSVRSVDR